MTEQVQRIKGYVKKFTTVTQEDDGLLEYSIEAVIDRLLLF